MTYEFQYLMHLLGAAASGKPASEPARDLDWQRVSALAQEQQLMPLLCCAMKQNPGIGYPKDHMRTESASVFQQVLTDCARRSAVIRLLEEMEREGIHAVVVKGFAVAAYYASPECRISSDTDIYIDRNDEEKACDFLRRHHFSVSPRWENGHHSIARHPTLGILEVHTQLYDEIVEDVWFQAIDRSSFLLEPQQKVETPDGSYYTLGDTDHLVFLVLHMVKHFILSGMSLRMMLDVARFYACHREHLDTQRLWDILCKLKYDQFVNAVLWAAIWYCGFTVDDFPGIQSENTQQTELILDDLECGGWLGKKNQQERAEGWHEYNRQLLMQHKSRLRYWLYMLNWKHSFKLRTFFPGRKRLSRDYPCVLKYPCLIPFVWVHRIIFRGGALLKKGAITSQIVSDENSINAEGRRRVSLFRALDML